MKDFFATKRIVSLLLAMLMVMSAVPQAALSPALASDVEAEEIVTETDNEPEALSEKEETPLWDFEKYGDGVEITAYNGTATDIFVPSTVKDGGKEYKVIRLADGLFKNNDGINSVTLGAGILEIGAEAFYDCDSLACVLIAEETTTIGDRAFYGCDSFNSIILYNAVVNFGADVFTGASKAVLWVYTDSAAHSYARNNNLTYKLMDGSASLEIYYVDGVKYHIQDGQAYAIGYDRKHTTVNDDTVINIPTVVEGCPVTVIYDNCFKGQNYITEVNLPDSIKNIKAYAFSDCTNLVTINLPNALKIVGDYAFNNDKKAEIKYIPDSVTSIGAYSFYYCSKLTATLPRKLESLGNSSFIYSGIGSLVIPSTLKSWGTYTFQSCNSIKEVYIENGITTIPQAAFISTTSIEKVTFPETLTSIGGSAFYTCRGIKSVVFPESLTTIGGNAFYGCGLLTEVIIPENCKVSCSGTFAYCTSLETVIFKDGAYVDGTTKYSWQAKAFTGTIIKHLTISGAQNRIYGNAYGRLDSVETLTLGEGIEYIFDDVFDYATKLISVVIPKSSKTTGRFPIDTVQIVWKDSEAHKAAVRSDALHYVYDGTNEPVITNVGGITYLVTDTEAIAFRFDGSVKDVVVPSSVEGKPVTTLYSTFKNEKNITSVTLPDSVTDFKNGAFLGCESLTEIVIPKNMTRIGNKSFEGCINLKKVVFNENLTEIGEDAFKGCTSFTTMVIPEGITILGKGAFTVCTGLKEVYLPESLKRIEHSVFNECTSLVKVDMPESLEYMGAPFLGCTALETIEVPEGVTIIASNTFRRCSNLKNVKFPSYVKQIDMQAFQDCYSLEHIDIPQGTEVLSPGVFTNCTSLKSITFPNTLKTIERNAFENCTSLVSVEMPDSITTLYSNVFKGCTALERCILSKNIVEVPSGTFYECTNLESIEIPKGVKTIGGSAFFNSGISSITISNTVTRIDDLTFSGCVNLENVVIPESVTSVGLRLFYNCKNLKTVDIQGKIVGKFDEIFSGCTSLGKVTFGEGTIPSNSNVFAYASVEEINIPASAQSVMSRFATQTLKRVTLADTITTIPSKSFVDCTNIQTVVIPQSVTTMYTDSFASNTVLLVYENSYAHRFAMENDLLYFVYDGVNIPKIVVVDDVVYCVMTDYAIAIAYTGTAMDVVICEVVDGVTVTELRATFRDNTAITSVKLPLTITNIGDYTFQNCSALVSVNIPANVTNIGRNAFQNCTSMKSDLNLHGVVSIGDYAFQNCHAVDKLTLGEKLNSIGQYAFFGCSTIKTVVIPTSVTAVGQSCFENCTGMTSVTVNSGIKTIPSSAFKNCSSLTNVELADGITCIDEWAFTYCSNLKTIEIPNTVNTINRLAFGYCGSLESIVLPTGISVIEASVFTNCSSLNEVVIPHGVTIIEDRAFYYCSSLETINFPDSLWKIGEQAFYSCRGLKEIDLNKVHFMEREVFYDCRGLTSLTIKNDCLSWPNIFSYCTSLKTVVVGEGVTTLCNAFEYCPNLETIDLPSTLTKIFNRDFNGCGSLKNVNIKEGTSIIFTAFGSCGNLDSIYIPKSVTYIENGAFPVNTILLVHKDSYAHKFAQEHDLLYFVLHNEGNPDIAYGTAIEGTVRFMGGAAVNGATVDLIYDDGTVKETVKTDANGKYSFTYAEVGRYTIRATYNYNGTDLTANTQYSVKRLNVFSVFAEGDANLKLKTGWNVSGTVTGYEDGDTVNVSLTDKKGNVVSTTKAENGAFSFANIYNDEYTVKAESSEASAIAEIRVFDADISGIVINLPVKEKTGTVGGYVEIASRADANGNVQYTRRNWIEVKLYNSEGVVVKSTKTDGEGYYEFTGLPVGSYKIVAETHEMRPARYWVDGKEYFYSFDKNYTLTGYASISIPEGGSYTVSTIVLREIHEKTTTLEGKVTANGETQDCVVTLKDSYGNELATYTTKKNGKYAFANVVDGAYYITAVTKSDGVGYIFFTVENGTTDADLHIKVLKSAKVKAAEDAFLKNVPECNTREEALQYKDLIVAEKQFYDALPEKEKLELSEAYVNRLLKCCELIANVSLDYEAPAEDEPVNVENAGSAVSGGELDSEVNIQFKLTVEKKDAKDVNPDGLDNEEDYIHHMIAETAGKSGKIKKYYEISMTKQVGDGEPEPIESVCRDTESTGKFRITLTIPVEDRGHKHYSIIHEHHGEIVTLSDLDDDPNTITIEVDRFSTFVLTATDVELILEVEDPLCEINGVPYESLAEAIAEVKNGETITLLKDCNENVTIKQTAGLSFTIDGNGKTYTGTITVDGNKRYTGTETLTIKNMNFVLEGEGQSGIFAVKSSYVHNVTVDGCTFTGTDAKQAYGIRLNHAYNIIVKNTTGSKLCDLVYGQTAVTGLTVENVKVTESVNGFFMSYGMDLKFTGLEIDVSNTGVYVNNYNASNATFENCNIKALQPVVLELKSATKAYTYVFDGINNFEGAGSDGNWLFVKGTGGKVTINLSNATGLSIEGISYNGEYYDISESEDKVWILTKFKPIATVGDEGYRTLGAAIEAAKDGDTVLLLADIDIANEKIQTLDGQYNTYYRVADKTVTVDLNGKKIYGEYTNSIMLVGVFSTEDDGHLTLTGEGTVDVTATTSVYALIASYDETSSVTIVNGTYKLDKAVDSLIYSGGSATENDKGVRVMNGFFWLGNVGTGANGKPWIFNVLGANDRYVIVTGGTYNSKISHQFWAHEVEIPETMYLKDNGNKTWTVTDGAVAYAVEVDHGYDRYVGYSTLAEALKAVKADGMVILLADVVEESMVIITRGVTLDLNGKTLKTEYLVAFNGNKVVDSSDGEGFLMIPENNICLTTEYATKDNGLMIPVYDGSAGYIFTEVKYATTGISYLNDEANTARYKFIAKPNAKVVELLKDGVADNRIRIVVQLKWNTDDGVKTQELVYNEAMIAEVYTNNPQLSNTGTKFTVDITGYEGISGLTVNAVVVSDFGVMDASSAKTITE